jgi:tetratricopeptide (TPR) repeat protein
LEPVSTTYGIREVAELLGVPAARVRSLARAGLVEPSRGAGGELRFGFRELAFLRQVRDLPQDGVTPRRLRRALSRLRAALPPERDLCELGLATASGELVVRETGRLWSPESGQLVFDFERAEGVGRAARRIVSLAEKRDPEPTDARDGDAWYRLGCDLESSDPERARAAYQRALELDPEHSDARVNLGCLEHEAGRLDEAERLYRAALALRDGDVTARFDLAVVLEDRGRNAEARETYLACLARDPACAEAHFNLARLADRSGQDEALVRHLVAYRRLVRDESR